MNTILVIEDDYTLRDNIKKMLEKHDYKVITASDGVSGISIAKGFHPDLILSDIMMPTQDGFSVKEELEQDSSTRSIPFIFLSARAELSDIREGMNLGADDYITKPFKMADLLTAIKIRLDRARTISTNTSSKEIEKPNNKKSSFNINVNGSSIVVNYKDILFIEAKSVYVILHLNNGKEYEIRKLLKDFEEFLPEENFIRIHRSIIINSEYLKDLYKKTSRNYLVTLEGYSAQLPISQRYASKLKSLLDMN